MNLEFTALVIPGNDPESSLVRLPAEAWRRMVIASRRRWEAIPVPLKAFKANLPQYDLSQVAPQGYTG